MRWALLIVLLWSSVASAQVQFSPFNRTIVTVGSAAVESRCLELGANCGCSETLDATYSYPVGSEESVDFPISPDATECRPFEMEPVGGPAKFVSVTPPVPLGTVAKVMEAKVPPYAWLAGDTPSATTKRMCMRYYFIVADDFSGIGNLSCPAQRNKMMQASFAGGSGTISTPQLQERANTDPCSGPGYGAYREFWLDYQIGEVSLSPSLRFSDCNISSGKWCRVEMCTGSSSTLVTAGTSKTIEAYVKPVGVSESSASATATMRGASGPYWGADLYHGGGTGAVGSRYISHFMTAEWDTNAGQRIGCAEEAGDC
jgi:hypothetical protein